MQFSNDKVINGFLMRKTVRFHFRGWEPCITVIEERERFKSTIVTGLFFPFYRTKRYLFNAFLWLKLKSQGFQPIKCQGGGCGWVEYTITNPNYGKTDKWKVCRYCVHDYDAKCTMKEFKYKKVKS